LPEHLPFRRTESLGSLDQICPHIANTEVSQPDNWRQRKNDRSDDAWHHANAEQHDDWYQINKRRNGLHDVEDRADYKKDPIAPRNPDTEPDSDDCARQNRGNDHRQRSYGFRPQPEHVDETQSH